MQKRSIEAWLQATENQELFYQWLAERENQSPQYLPELDNPLTAYAAFMDRNPEFTESAEVYKAENSPRLLKNSWFRWLVAASTILVLGIFCWLNQQTILFETHRTSYNETKPLNLADGTEVTLNSNSSLRVPRFGFGTQSREVKLEGEASFSVIHTADDQKFIVKTENDLEVVVLGTEFTVSARPRGAKVTLNKGKVKLHYGKQDSRKEVTMAPGELVTVDREGQAKLGKTNNTQPQNAWAAHQFVFEGTSLQELAYLFRDNFGLKIEIGDEELRAMSLYGSFRAESAEQLLQELSAAANLRYEQKNDTIYILPDAR